MPNVLTTDNGETGHGARSGISKFDCPVDARLQASTPFEDVAELKNLAFDYGLAQLASQLIVREGLHRGRGHENISGIYGVEARVASY